MPEFQYNAVNAKGESVSGSIEASSREHARQNLKVQGLRVQSVVQKAIQNEQNDGLQNIRPSDASELGQHVANLASAGLPMADGLRAIANEIRADSLLPLIPGRNQRQAKILNQVATRIEKGDALNDILKSFRVPSDLQCIIDAGMKRGRTPEAVGEYTAHARGVDSNTRFAAMTLSYPLVVIIAISGLATFILAIIVPQFRVIFEDFGIELPWMTQILIEISNFFVAILPFKPTLPSLLTFTLTVMLLMVFIPWLLIKSLSLGRASKRFRNRIPIIGSIFQWASMAKFSHLIAVLTNHEVPLPEALRLAGNGSADPDIIDACQELANQVDEGVPTPRISKHLEGFPAGFIQLMAAESDRDGIPEAMHSIANMYERRVRMQSTVLAGFLEPFILVFFIALPVGFLVIAMFFPLMRLLGNLAW